MKVEDVGAAIYLDGPAEHVLVSSDVAREETPLWDESMATDAGRAYEDLRLRRYWETGFGSETIHWSQPQFPEWHKGASVVCRCGRIVKAKRDWSPVRHKVDGDWCMSPGGVPVPG